MIKTITNNLFFVTTEQHHVLDTIRCSKPVKIEKKLNGSIISRSDIK
jgi:hypothetical protein